MAFFKASKATTGDPFLDAVVSIESTEGNFASVTNLRNSDVFTAIKIIASDIASSPLQVVKKGMPQDENEIVHLMNTKPNLEMDGWHFKFSLAANMLLNGNSFAEIIREDGKVKELHLLPNSSVTVKQNDSGKVSYQIGDKKRKKAPEDVLHFKYFTQDGLTGISPLYALKDEVKIQKAGNKTWFSFFTRGVNGTGILKVQKSDLDNNAKTAIREKFEAANGGENSLRTIILDDTMDYKTLEINTDVLKLVNSSDWTSKQIAKCFGIPVERLGVENIHSSNAQSNLLYLKNTLIHYFNVFTSELNVKLMEQKNMIYRFNTDYLMETDPETMITNTLKQVQGSMLTINEGRAKLGFPSVEGGDRLLASLNYTYLDTLEQYQFRETEEENGTGKTIE